MAQLNITLNQEEILELLQDSRPDAFKNLLQESLNGVLKAESAEQLRAEPYERTEERTDSRNGTRDRPLVTRLGRIELKVPRHRNVPFKTLVFDNYKRSEAALVTTMAEMVIGGVSTAKVGRVMEEICGTTFSKQAVSEACKELDSAVEAFRLRRLEGEYSFVMADATYIKVRENHRVIAKALLIAMGLTSEGMKEIIGLSLEDAETYESWKGFFQSLQKRGLKGMSMLTSDAHEGLLAAFHEVYPDVPWQRCQAHFTRNIVDGAPKFLRAGLRSELKEMFNCEKLEQARARRDEIIADYAAKAPKAMERLDKGFEEAMTVMILPKDMRKCTRTSNYLERLNKEIKRRSNVIGIFPNAGSAVRLLGAFLMEENDRWASMKKIYYISASLELKKKAQVLIDLARQQCLLAKAA